MNDNNQRWEFLSMLQTYYEDLECENEFAKVNESSIMPKYEDYEAIEEKISDSNRLKFNQFLKIYSVFTEVEEFENFTIEKARRVLESLEDHLFMEGHSPKYETHSLIEKFKINIAYQLSKLESIQEITEWLLIAEQIRAKWKDIDMVALMKSGCSFYMKHNSNMKIKDFRVLIILNKFIGNQETYQEKLWNDALEWLKANHKKKHRHCSAKSMLDALSKNNIKFDKSQAKVLNDIQEELNHWTFDANRKTKKYKGRIKNWLSGKKSKLKIIDTAEIPIKTKKLPGSAPDKPDLFECSYRNEKAFIKAYRFPIYDKVKLKRIYNEIANTIYLSKHNQTNIFMNFFGVYKEKLYEKTERTERSEYVAEEKNKEENYSLNIVMEWCSGTLEDYEEIFKNNSIALSNFADKILNGFLLLHNYGMAHNDIKPANILVIKTDNEIIYKIADYDVSSAISSYHAAMSENAVSPLAASYNFAAPEIRKLVDEEIWRAKISRMRADVFSLGLVLLYLATSEWPPEGLLGREQYIEYHMERLKIGWLKELLKSMISNEPIQRRKIGKLIEMKNQLMNT